MKSKKDKPENAKSGVYNPLAIPNLGKSLTDAFLEQPLRPLPLPSEPFPGAGIYGLYYVPAGEPYRFYEVIARRGLPLYIGKAVTKGTAKSLFTRLGNHRESIKKAPNLHVADFRCRFLIVDDVWIPLGEQLLIDKFQPLWNERIRGFGSKALGKERVSQRPSQWDLLHPGRQLTTNSVSDKELAKLEADLVVYLNALAAEQDEG